ncbi:MAG TPA: hypothetical protein VKV80_16940 [Streptosporangiaceae bacterium]|nr:hypothetical protein [Streptosporangiaceae bacterium]
MGRPRLELSGIQLAASVLASVTGAILASGLGVAGTIAGTAVAAFASTAGGAVYKHYLARTGERLRAVRPVIVQRARVRTAAGQPAGSRAAGGGAAGSPAGFNGHGGGAPASQPAQKFRVPGAAGGAGTGMGPGRAWTRPGGQPARAWARPDDQPTQPLRPLHAGAGPSGQGEEVPDRPAGGQRGAGVGQKDRRRLWLLVCGTSAGVFVLVMAAITVFELAAGKPLAAAAWGYKSSGTTIGDLVGGQHSTRAAPQPGAPATSHATAPAGPTRVPATPSSVPSAPASSPSAVPSPSRGVPSPAASPSPRGSLSPTANPYPRGVPGGSPGPAGGSPAPASGGGAARPGAAVPAKLPVGISVQITCT